MIAALIALPVSLFVIAFVEYAGHRWLLHRKTVSFGRDHLQHHKVYSLWFSNREEDHAWYDAVWVRGVLACLWSSIFAIPVAIWLSIPAAIVFVAVVTLHGTIWHWIHGQMHQPTRLWLQNSRFFKRITYHHAIHHHYPRKNYSFLFAPFFDVLFGTHHRPRATA